MKINTRTRYGVRLLFNLALNYEKGYLQLHDIAKSEHISGKYLEQIVSLLRTSKIVVSQRGAKGGYRLALEPSKVTLAVAVEALEGSLSVVDCLDDHDCDKNGRCASQKVWNKLDRAVRDTLSAVTLSDMVDDYELSQKELHFTI